MLSKIIARPDSEAIQPIVWKPAGAPSAAAPGSEEIGPALRQKIGALEQALVQQGATAHAKGFQEGQAAAHESAYAESVPIIERLGRSLQELAEMKPRLRREAESDVVQLAVAIARRILHRELTVDAAAMRALVQVALARLSQQEVYRVRVHPGQAEAVRSALEGRSIEVIASQDREPGALIFETNRGKLDASAQTQLDEIQRGLTDRVNRA
jgi:flagellar assembly protein FliH